MPPHAIFHGYEVDGGEACGENPWIASTLSQKGLMKASYQTNSDTPITGIHPRHQHRVLLRGVIRGVETSFTNTNSQIQLFNVDILSITGNKDSKNTYSAPSLTPAIRRALYRKKTARYAMARKMTVGAMISALLLSPRCAFWYAFADSNESAMALLIIQMRLQAFSLYCQVKPSTNE